MSELTMSMFANSKDYWKDRERRRQMAITLRQTFDELCEVSNEK